MLMLLFPPVDSKDVLFFLLKRSTFQRPRSTAAAAPLNLASRADAEIVSRRALRQQPVCAAVFFSLFPPCSIIIIIIVASGREEGERGERAVAGREGAG